MQREIIKISEAVKITGLSKSALIKRINDGLLTRAQLDNPYSKKRTLRVYRDEIEELCKPIDNLPIQEDKIIIKHKVKKQKIIPKQHTNIQELLNSF